MQIRFTCCIVLLVLPFVSILNGCNSKNTSKKSKNRNILDSLSAFSAEKKEPNSDFAPAFEGQTRVHAIKTITPYKVEKVTTGLGRPWAIIAIPGNRLLVTEKSGYMEIRSAGGTLIKKITGLPKVEDAGQGGLLDVALDPDFSTNSIIYWSYSEKYGNGNLTAVAKGFLKEESTVVENAAVIFRATPALESELHFGSRLAFDKEGFLYVSVGERSILEGRKQAQWLNSGLGKIFRITKEGTAAPGNPFFNNSNAQPEIFSYGHRNVQSLAFHPVTGALWEAEFGPRGGDELNLIKPGKNYGWPIITYGIEYGGDKIGNAIQQKAGMEQPVYYWDPVISPSGMTFYTGDAIPEWKNNLFIGGLSSQQIIRLIIDNNRVVGEEYLLTDENERIRDIMELNGCLYAITDSGVLFKISKK